jgi:hypothetical protein
MHLIAVKLLPKSLMNLDVQIIQDSFSRRLSAVVLRRKPSIFSIPWKIIRRRTELPRHRSDRSTEPEGISLLDLLSLILAKTMLLSMVGAQETKIP